MWKFGKIVPFFSEVTWSNCSKLTIETLEQGVKHVQSKQYIHKNDANGVVLVSSLLTSTDFTPCSSVSFVNTEHVNASWARHRWTNYLKILCIFAFVCVIILFIYETSKETLTFHAPCISKSCIEIKINLNFYFHFLLVPQKVL